MVGNDVVDLRDADAAPGAHHPRFDARVFAPAEREQLERSGAPNRLRWILWASKEAAYKVARKLDPRVVFSPSRFVVELDPSLRGTVAHEDARFPVWVDVLPEAVHAVATSGDVEPDHVRAELRELKGGETDPSHAVRALVVRALAPVLGEDPSDVVVASVGRVPRLHVRGDPAPADLSLSHHGALVAYAAELHPEPRGEAPRT